MTKGRRKRPTAGEPHGRSFAAGLTTTSLAAAILGSLLLTDTGAEAAFDAPKRLVAMLGVAIAAATVLFFWPRGERALSFAHRAAAALFGVAMVSALVTTVYSPRATMALDAFRAVAVFGSLPLIGSSALLGRRHWRVLLISFVGGAAVNAAMSIGQAAGVLHPFQYSSVGGRENISALIGNDGVLALVVSLAAVVVLDMFLRTQRGMWRAAAGALALLFIITMVVNRSLTSVVAMLLGASAVALCRARTRRNLALIAGAVVTLMLAAALIPSARSRLKEARVNAAAGNWNALLSFRGAAWGAAIDMIAARPLGWGAGTFPAEFVPHLISAELRFQHRLTNPLLSGGYYEAHSDYLQASAELGVVSTTLALAAVVITLCLLFRGRNRIPDAALIIGLIVASAAAALTWFPLQRPATSLLPLIAIGRGWRSSVETTNSQ